MIDVATFWTLLGISWMLMIFVGVIILRRNNYLLRRNEELELALADLIMKVEVEKLIQKMDNPASAEDCRYLS